MTPSAASETSTDVLERVRARQQSAEVEQREMLIEVAEFAAMHSPESLPFWDVYGGSLAFGDRPLSLGGDGAPGVCESAVVELAAALGWSTEAGQAYLADAIELRYRLPRLWKRLTAGEVPTWRARRIAGHTLSLSWDAAEYVDQHVAGFADRIGPAALERLCDEARDRFDPEEAELRRLDRAETRHVSIRMPDHRLDEGFTGLAYVDATLDAADALDLEHAIRNVASELRGLGSPESLDVRRALALGELARTQLTLALNPDHEETEGAAAGGRVARGSEERATLGRIETTDRPPARVKPRQTVLTVHLSADSFTTGITACDELKSHLSVDQVLDWLTGAGLDTTDITIKPVIDLNEQIECSGYTPSPRLREQIVLAEQICAFPHCTSPASRADLDHVVPWDDGGSTSSENLAPLCRRHHRAKTFMGWGYVKHGPRHYAWRSPTGRVYDKRGPTTVQRC